MRSFEYLIQLFPDKTGREIVQIQKQEKLDDEKLFQKLNKKKLEIINDINTNGGYYRGKFGNDQHYFYRVYNMRLEGSKIYMDVEKLIVFINQETEKSNVTLERSTKIYQTDDTYCLQNEERVTKQEWDEVNEYVNNITKFWEHIKPV